MTMQFKVAITPLEVAPSLPEPFSEEELIVASLHRLFGAEPELDLQQAEEAIRSALKIYKADGIIVLDGERQCRLDDAAIIQKHYLLAGRYGSTALAGVRMAIALRGQSSATSVISAGH